MINFDILKPLDQLNVVNYYTSAPRDIKTSIKFHINDIIRANFKSKVSICTYSPLRGYLDQELYVRTSNPIGSAIEQDYCKILMQINELRLSPKLTAEIVSCLEAESYNLETYNAMEASLSIVESKCPMSVKLIMCLTDILIFKMRSMIYFESLDVDNDRICNQWSSFEFILLSITSTILYEEIDCEKIYDLALLIYMYHRLLQPAGITYIQNLFFDGFMGCHPNEDLNELKGMVDTFIDKNVSLYDASSHITDVTICSKLTANQAFSDLIRNELNNVTAEEKGKIIIFGDTFVSNLADVHAILSQISLQEISKYVQFPVTLALSEDDLGFLRKNFENSDLRMARIVKNDPETGLIFRDVVYYEGKIFMLFARKSNIKEIYGLEYTLNRSKERELIRFDDETRNTTQYQFSNTL